MLLDGDRHTMERTDWLLVLGEVGVQLCGAGECALGDELGDAVYLGEYVSGVSWK
jgi:hypothetical protein